MAGAAYMQCVSWCGVLSLTVRYVSRPSERFTGIGLTYTNFRFSKISATHTQNTVRKGMR